MPGPGADSIVVVGGYGAVGQIVCTTLAERFPGKVFAAGRNVRKAEAFSRRAGCCARSIVRRPGG